MECTFCLHTLTLKSRWTIATSRQRGGDQTVDRFFITLRDGDSTSGYGEAAPRASNESNEQVRDALVHFNAADLSFTHLDQSLAAIAPLRMKSKAAHCAIETALFDGAARTQGLSLSHYLGCNFIEGAHVSSFSIGINAANEMHAQIEAAPYPLLKIKVGGSDDLALLRAMAPSIRGRSVRLDANGGWHDPEAALRLIEFAAKEIPLQLVEQPLPPDSTIEAHRWLKQRSPVPILADESFARCTDLEDCAEGFHGINVKIVKLGGIADASKALALAPSFGLRTMLGCMLDSSVLISAAAHLAPQAEFIDLDSILLLNRDPFCGVTMDPQGVLSFSSASEKHGLCVSPRPARS